MNEISAHIIQAAKSVAAQHPESQVFYATQDGTVFLEGNQRHAQNHASTLNKVVYEFSRVELMGTANDESSAANQQEDSTTEEVVIDPQPTKKSK